LVIDGDGRFVNFFWLAGPAFYKCYIWELDQIAKPFFFPLSDLLRELAVRQSEPLRVAWRASALGWLENINLYNLRAKLHFHLPDTLTPL
jgi:hypothetical protein